MKTHYAAGEPALRHAVEVGRLLLEAKVSCKHGDWLTWLEDNFDGSVRTAQDYMRLAKNTKAIQSFESIVSALKTLKENSNG